MRITKEKKRKSVHFLNLNLVLMWLYLFMITNWGEGFFYVNFSYGLKILFLCLINNFILYLLWMSMMSFFHFNILRTTNINFFLLNWKLCVESFYDVILLLTYSLVFKQNCTVDSLLRNPWHFLIISRFAFVF